MELFGPDFEQYEEVQAELDCIAIDIAEVEREAEVNLLVCLAPKLKGLQILGIGWPISLPWQLWIYWNILARFFMLSWPLASKGWR